MSREYARVDHSANRDLLMIESSSPEGPSARDSGSPPTRAFWRFVKRLGLVVAIIAGILAIVTTAGGWLSGAAGPAVTPSASQSATGRPSATESSRGGTQDASQRCLDGDFRSTDCTLGAEWIVLLTSQCSEEGGARSLGVQPDERQISLKVQQHESVCLGRPGVVAKAAGAVVEDILKIERGERVSRLSLCALDPNAPVVACTNAHYLEFVGDWRAGSAEERSNQRCGELVRKFLIRDLDPLGGALSVEMLSRGQRESAEYRCVIRSKGALYGSLWHIGGDALPSEPPP